MAINTHDWLTSVNLSGLTVSEPVLLEHFRDGPPSLGNGMDTAFRREYTRWLTTTDVPKAQRRWIDFILEDLTGHGGQAFQYYPAIDERLTVELAEYEQKLHPTRVLADADGKAQLLVVIVPSEQDLDRKETETGRWRASPFTKFNRLLRQSGVPLGLLTNGADWRLIYAEQPTTAYIQWSAQGWSDERVTLRAFAMLVGRQRFDPSDPNTQLVTLIRDSQDRQIDVADQLGDQVRAAIRVLVHCLDDLDQAAQGTLLSNVTPADIYEIAIIFMMRLVFLLYAEEHKLLPHGERLYDQGYGLTYLWTRLQQQRRERPETLPHTYDAWMQLLAAFNLVYEGVDHPDFNTPAYGGGLFDPDRFPVLAQIRISNDVVDDILRRLLMAETILGHERVVQRVSYRALDVEQFGYMYEGLLDHVVKRADELMLALTGAKHKDPVLTITELEQKTAAGRDALIEYLVERTGRSENALGNALDAEVTDPDLEWLRDACDNNEAIYNQARPYLYLLDDGRGTSPVIPAGRLYIGDGPTRRATGTHYTPITLTEPIVRHTLEPLVYVGPAEGLPQEQWKLRPARELLDLKICDMAMGSGAFLVQADRYLADKLVEAWGLAEHAGGEEIRITPYGERAKGKPGELLIPDDADARVTLARRLAADRCLYGVDKNPLATEIAKLSLWLITMDRQRPFTFLDHALKSGDSLVGISLEQLQAWNLQPEGKTPRFGTLRIQEAIEAVIDLRRQIAILPVMSVEDQHRKEDLLYQAEARTNDLRDAANLLVGSYFNDLGITDQQTIRDVLLEVAQQGHDIPVDIAAMCDLGILEPFHWELEFPEIFIHKRKGFDVFIGNPPFLGGKRISTIYGENYASYLRMVWNHAKGSADLCTYFFLSAFRKTHIDGAAFGLIGTKTIAQGGTRLLGLSYIVKNHGAIYWAVSRKKWPRKANVVVSIASIYKGEFKGQKQLDGKDVATISTYLDSHKDLKEPKRLANNKGIGFVGTFINGAGFIIDDAEARVLLESNAKNHDVLFRYLVGEDLNEAPDQIPNRWVINFFDWNLDQSAQYPECLSLLTQRVKHIREELVKQGGQIHEYDYWKFWDKRLDSYARIRNRQQVLTIALTSQTCAFVFVPNNMVFSHMVGVFDYDTFGHFAVLQSVFHVQWAYKYGSSLKQDLNYTIRSIFETFPLPKMIETIDSIGEQYHEYRREIMLSRGAGLTDIYNRLHNLDNSEADIVRLRKLQIEMDRAVAAAYGWNDLDLGHGFHETAQGTRYTISEEARREVLTRLLQLNHERYEEEVRQGLHEKQGGKSAQGKKKSKPHKLNKGTVSDENVFAPPQPDQLSLFPEEDESPRQLWLGESGEDEESQ